MLCHSRLDRESLPSMPSGPVSCPGKMKPVSRMKLHKIVGAPMLIDSRLQQKNCGSAAGVSKTKYSQVVSHQKSLSRDCDLAFH